MYCSVLLFVTTLSPFNQNLLPIMKKLLTLMLVVGFLFAFTACENKSTAEKVEDAVEEAADDVEDAVEDAVDETTDAVEEAAEEVEAEVDSIGVSE